jgi:hypothetical protein
MAECAGNMVSLVQHRLEKGISSAIGLQVPLPTDATHSVRRSKYGGIFGSFDGVCGSCFYLQLIEEQLHAAAAVLSSQRIRQGALSNQSGLKDY